MRQQFLKIRWIADESVTDVFCSAQVFSVSSSQAPKIIRGITSDAPKIAPSTQLPRSSYSSQTKVPHSSHSSAPPQTQVPRSSHSSAPPQTQVPRSSHSSAPPQTQVPLSSCFSAPPQTQVPRSSHSTAPPQNQVPRSSRFSAPPQTQVPRSSPSSVPPSTQIPRSFAPSIQSPSSSSTLAANSDPESSQYRQEVSVPPPTQPTPTPTTYNLDPAIIIRNSLRAWTVYILNPSGGFDLANMTLKLLIDLKKGRRVVVDFEGLSPFGNAAGLLGAACGASVYEVGESSGSSKVLLETLEGALKEVAALKSIIKKLVPVAEFEKAFREKIQTVGVEDWTVKLEEDDDSSDESNGA
ncbi:hypothetical protein ACFE04_027680 [Oxalis oulophora]